MFPHFQVLFFSSTLTLHGDEAVESLYPCRNAPPLTLLYGLGSLNHLTLGLFSPAGEPARSEHMAAPCWSLRLLSRITGFEPRVSIWMQTRAVRGQDVTQGLLSSWYVCLLPVAALDTAALTSTSLLCSLCSSHPCFSTKMLPPPEGFLLALPASLLSSI